MKQNNSIKNILLFFALCCCWGPSFLFMKIAVEFIPPITIAAVRVSIAAIFLYLILKIQKINLPKFSIDWKHFAVMGFFSCALPFSFFSISEKYIDSSFASILNGTTPLFTILIAHFYTFDDRLNVRKIIGSIIGFVGLIILVAPSLFMAKAEFFGIVLAIIAAASYAVGFVYAKKNISGFQPLIVPTAQLILSALFLLPIAFILEDPFAIKYISMPAIFSMLAISIGGSALAFIIFYKLIAATSATYVAAINYVLPIFGVVLGVIILHEQITWNIYFGSAIIFLGIILTTTSKKTYPD